MAKKIPSSVVIKGRDWEIKDHPDNGVAEATDGCCLSRHQLLLVLSRESVSDQYYGEVLVHELLHAMWATAGLEEVAQKDEETVVSLLAPVLLDLIVKNPKLIKYVQSLQSP